MEQFLGAYNPVNGTQQELPDFSWFPISVWLTMTNKPLSVYTDNSWWKSPLTDKNNLSTMAWAVM